MTNKKYPNDFAMFRLPMADVVIKEEPADEEMPLDENGPEELNGCSDQECNNLSNTLNILHAERNLENGNGCLPNSQISNGENAIIKDNHHKKLAEKLKHTDVVIKEEPTDPSRLKYLLSYPPPLR